MNEQATRLFATTSEILRQLASYLDATRAKAEEGHEGNDYSADSDAELLWDAFRIVIDGLGTVAMVSGFETTTIFYDSEKSAHTSAPDGANVKHLSNALSWALARMVAVEPNLPRAKIVAKLASDIRLIWKVEAEAGTLYSSRTKEEQIADALAKDGVSPVVAQ